MDLFDCLFVDLNYVFRFCPTTFKSAVSDSAGPPLQYLQAERSDEPLSAAEGATSDATLQPVPFAPSDRGERLRLISKIKHARQSAARCEVPCQFVTFAFLQADLAWLLLWSPAKSRPVACIKVIDC